MRAYRSPVRLFVFGIIGILLIVAAVDVMFGHWVSTVPEVNDDGALTTRGQAQQRGDIVWGAALLGAGTLLFGGTVIELARRKPLVEVREDGLVLAIGTTERDVVVPWSEIEAISGAVFADANDGGERGELVVTVKRGTEVPEEMVGATWIEPALHVDAHEWSEPLGDVVLAAQGALEYFHRIEAIEAMGEPSLTWETSVAASPPTSQANGKEDGA